MTNFINRISGNGEMIVEYCRDCSSEKKEHDYNKTIERFYDKKNLFFSCGIKDINKNRSRLNISKINRITIDIDFRKAFIGKHGENISNEEIIAIANELGEFLKKDYPEDFGQRNYIVFSGNGIHIHYIGNVYNIKSIEETDLIRDLVLDFYREFNSIMGDDIFFADEKVGDVGHLFRLPGTINSKNGIDNECVIVAEQNIDSQVVNALPELIKLARNRRQIKELEFIKQQREKLKINKKKYGGSNPFEWINQNVDVADVIQILIPERTLKKDLKNFNNPAKGKNVNGSYFVDREHNILIRNGSTKLPGTKSGFNVVSLICEWFGFKGKECLEWLVKNNLVSDNILNN